MTHRVKHTIILCLFAAFSVTLVAQDSQEFEKGLLYYNQRHKNARNLKADKTIIYKAIQHFEQAHKEKPTPLTYEYLLRSYYFAGFFVAENDENKLYWYSKGTKIGKEAAQKYPENAPILYWYLANISQESKIEGIWFAINNKTLSKAMKLIDDIIRIDPYYQGGGGYRNKAILYYKVPYIPFVLTFPDDEEALKYFEKALEIDPAHPTTLYFYAECLNDLGEEEKARKALEKIIRQPPRQSYYLEDSYLIAKAKKLLEEL
ncbi:MAG: tetratricopeptide repeat protein [Bacteroidetes bacterium]|nr:MAG: tetratricopeptide repeat protein [Bacteroidota bacterium]